MIKEYFANYMIHQSDVTFDLGSDEIHVHKKRNEDWKITLVDTGETSQTGEDSEGKRFDRWDILFHIW